MGNKKQENPSVYPYQSEHSGLIVQGIKLRDKIAIAAMNGAMSDFKHWSAMMYDYKNEKQDDEGPREYASRIFYEMADAMLKARENGKD